MKPSTSIRHHIPRGLQAAWRGQRRLRTRRERGAIIVLTSISMVVMLTFSAFAIDIGQRNQNLAKAQHAIDAAVLTAAQYLGTVGASANGGSPDYAGAVARAKEVIRENLGITEAAWATCADAEHLPITVAGDTQCISFEKIDAAASPSHQTTHNIRVKLPTWTMNTIFGGVTGTQNLDISAAAASNGNSCSAGGSGCNVTTTTAASTTSTTTPAPPTTTHQYGCQTTTFLWMAVDDVQWQLCKDVLPGVDIINWRIQMCNTLTSGANLPTTFLDPTIQTWMLGIANIYTYYWPVCSPYTTGGNAARDTYFNGICYGDLSVIYSSYYITLECITRNPGLQTYESYWASTTTTSTTPISTTTTTTTTPPVTTPGSIDING